MKVCVSLAVVFLSALSAAQPPSSTATRNATAAIVAAAQTFAASLDDAGRSCNSPSTRR
jgi:hypothetical protein